MVAKSISSFLAEHDRSLDSLFYGECQLGFPRKWPQLTGVGMISFYWSFLYVAIINSENYQRRNLVNIPKKYIYIFFQTISLDVSGVVLSKIGHIIVNYIFKNVCKCFSFFQTKLKYSVQYTTTQKDTK